VNVESRYFSIGRIPITRTWPQVDGGRFPVKAFQGEVIEFGAIAFREGHDSIAVELHLTSPSGKKTLHTMQSGPYGLDKWTVSVQLSEIGNYSYQVSAWDDAYHSWLHNTEVKLKAGVDSELMMLEGERLLRALAENSSKDKRALLSIAKDLVTPGTAPEERLKVALETGLTELAERNPLRGLESRSPEVVVLCERKLAGSGSWYEFFPRSEGAIKKVDGSFTSGNFKTAVKSLTRVQAMGFEVLYLPPIHPIGTSHRKGPNNTLTAGPNDPGSPWAIGSSAGGHDTIHPDLGSEKDFKDFIKAANKLGIEVAMDLALQASPDHPWVKTNPEWFTTRADGSIAYAENPPKKYQDIYPINFDNDPEGIYHEVLRVLNKWISFGIKIFRVDNPHTKPVSFWQRLIAEVNKSNPEVIFLAEAFTRPAMMHALGKAGFQQSYCYFSWRNHKDELADYLRELSQDSADFFRPALWVNTPDILTEYLQFGGRPAFKIRATIAATAGSTWGMYSGFELYESVARPGAEENIDSEKFEYKLRDFAAAEISGDSLAPRIALLNKIRKENPALQQLRNLKLHWSDDPEILVYSKHLDAEHAGQKANTILVVVNTDPHSVRETTVHLDLKALGAQGKFKAMDLITGQSYQWGEHNFVRLDAFTEPAHIFRVEQ
jgi:starch synthase (maltosyl-transferring)